MDYNGKLLARARARLAEQRERNAAEQRRRMELAYARLPRLRGLDRQLRMQMTWRASPWPAAPRPVRA